MAQRDRPEGKGNRCLQQFHLWCTQKGKAPYQAFPFQGNSCQPCSAASPWQRLGSWPRLSATSRPSCTWGKYCGDGKRPESSTELTLPMAMAQEAGPELSLGSAASPWGWGGAAGQRGALPQAGAWATLSCRGKRRTSRSSAVTLPARPHRHSATLLLCQAVRSLTAPA